MNIKFSSFFVAFSFLFAGSLAHATASVKILFEDGLRLAGSGEYSLAKKKFEEVKEGPVSVVGTWAALDIISDLEKKQVDEKIVRILLDSISSGYNRKYKLAIQQANKAININPGYAPAYSLIGAYQKKQKNYDAALYNYSKAIKLRPKEIRFYVNRGIAFGSKGLFKNAIADFDRALRLDTEFSYAYYNRALAWHKMKNYDKAAEDYSKTIELRPQSHKAYNNRGIIYKKKKMYKRALADLSKAIELYPANARSYNTRGGMYLGNLGDSEKGCADLAKACELGRCKFYKREVLRGTCSTIEGVGTLLRKIVVPE